MRKSETAPSNEIILPCYVCFINIILEEWFNVIVDIYKIPSRLILHFIKKILRDTVGNYKNISSKKKYEG